MVARRAGRKLASSATAMRNVETAAKVMGSKGLTLLQQRPREWRPGSGKHQPNRHADAGEEESLAGHQLQHVSA